MEHWKGGREQHRPESGHAAVRCCCFAQSRLHLTNVEQMMLRLSSHMLVTLVGWGAGGAIALLHSVHLAHNG